MTPLAECPAMQMKKTSWVNEPFCQVCDRTWRRLAKRSGNYRILIIRVNPNNPWLKNTDLTDLTDFRFALRGGGCGACNADGGV